MNKLIKVISGLGKIYPVYLLLLAFSPIVTGYIINFNLMESRYIIIQLIWIPVFTIPALLLQKRFLFNLIYTLYFIAGTIEIAHWIILKGPLSLTSILVISNTNLQESLDFFDLKTPYGLILLIPYFIVYLLALRSKIPSSDFKSDKYIFSVILLISIIFILENTIHGRLIRKGVPQIAKTTVSFFNKMKLYEEALQEKEPKNIDAVSACQNKRQTIVLILGESANRNHYSLYGYKRKTSPLLDNRNDIIVYTDVVSPYSNTLSSVLSILSESNLENKIDINKSIDIIDVLHSAGFKTYWISNQSPIGVWDNMVTVFANKADKTVFVNISSNSSFEAINTASYDSKLFKPLKKSLNDNAQKKFIVIHLMGSHAKYSKRYPKRFKIFRGENKKEKTIAQYDNSILFNDFVVDSILNLISNNSINKNDISAAIYLSDHSENVYDEGDNVGHDYSGVLPKANVEIPFVIWLSDNYRKYLPEKSVIIENNKTKPFVTDDLFHTLIDLSCVKTSVFDKKRSIFDKNFNSTRKRILEDHKDYDLK